MEEKVMIQPNWDFFKYKFTGRAGNVFEEWCCKIFCRKYKQPEGVSGYKNQSRIEVNPIQFEGKSIGFQAKFYDHTTLANNKNSLLKLVKDVRSAYPKLDEVVIFTHKEWGQAKISVGGDWRSQAQREIESLGSELSLKIEWFDAKKFYSDFVTIICNDLCEYYFGDKNSRSENVVKDSFVKFDNSFQIKRPLNFKQLDLSGLEEKFFDDAIELITLISEIPNLTRSFYAHALAYGHPGDLSVYCDPYELSFHLHYPLEEFHPHFVILEKMKLMWLPEVKADWQTAPKFGCRSYFRQLDSEDNGIYFLCLILRRFVNERKLIVNMIEKLDFTMLEYGKNMEWTVV